MAIRLLKCYYDGDETKYPKEELHEFHGKNYCLPHYNLKVQEDRDRNKLYAMIRRYYHVKYPTGLMMGQIKKFQTVNGYTLAGIAETVDYMASLSWVAMDETKGLGLVPYLYEEANNAKTQKLAQVADMKKVPIQSTITVDKNKFNGQRTIKAKKFDFGE